MGCMDLTLNDPELERLGGECREMIGECREMIGECRDVRGLALTEKDLISLEDMALISRIQDLALSAWLASQKPQMSDADFKKRGRVCKGVHRVANAQRNIADTAANSTRTSQMG